jgi:cytosine/adenosine deaminase-related metal-dependent hydrolase
MKYRKLSANYLFTGKDLLDKNYVLITENDGTIIDVISADDAGEDLEKFDGMLSPGFINAHCHTELAHLKGYIPEKTGLGDFVYQVITGRHFDEKDIISAIENAEAEMLKCGIVAVGDICNNNLTLSQKKKGRLNYYNFIEVSGWNPQVATARFEKGKAFYNEFEKNNLTTSIVPHAPYSVSEDLWGKITPFFPGKVISIHNQEVASEDEFFLNGTGKLVDMYQKMNIDNSFFKFPKLRSLQTYFKRLSGAASVILVHNTFTEQQDIDYVNSEKPNQQLVSFCLCINANLYIEDALPPVELFLRNDCNLVIGTDSVASNHQLNILEELKTISKNFPEISTETLLKWATINGAKALQMEDKLGSFEKGKKPGIVLIENIAFKQINEHSSARRIL